NTVAEAVRMVDAVGSPALRTMVDSRSATESERVPVAQVLERWLPTGKACHVHVNDPNRRGPGQGSIEFAPICAALAGLGDTGIVSDEPFDYYPNGHASAARAIGYIRGILEGMKSKPDPAQ